MKVISLNALLIIMLALATGCSRSNVDLPGTSSPSSLKDIAAVRLNYRYEADVPPPDAPKDATKEDRNAAVQSDFDANRPQEVLDKTITSPDAKRVLAVYHKAGDMPSEFRLDMYTGDGRILKKVTADVMAVHFPDTIRWSPDSSTLAFVAMIRGAEVDTTSTAPAADPETSTAPSTQNTPGPPSTPEADANVDANSNSNVNSNAATSAPTPAAPTGILTFRTEQIYICNLDGDGAKAITQNEGLIYFYYVWAPDSSALAALAAKSIEWRYLNDRAEHNGEMFVPVGRPRVIEKNGRERRLDDALTAVQPVWSPDSSKVACAFDNQVRIYDAAGNTPTQAAIPLRNNLLISSQAYDRDQASKLGANATADSNSAPPSNSNTAAAPTTLPDEKTLVSYNPIVALNWTADDLLYFETAYIKRMKNEGDSVTSFPRWHRLVLTPQATGR
ncbi:MAG TPA: hypothetical protein VMZ26_04075 [Pyrinomonadaceae bacterium]|nr:hypothetical protein [Pyrinomonadaceae bacterium]